MSQDYRKLLRDDASWEVGFGASTEFCGWSGAVNYVIDSYAVFNGEQYANLGVSSILEHDNTPPWCGPFYISSVVYPTNIWLREDTVNGQVYQLDLDLNTERLLYDFAAQVGDTLFDYFVDISSFGDPSTVVLSIDTFLMSDGALHRQWNLRTYGVQDHFYIEGVGSELGILHDTPFVFGWGTLLWCYKRNTTDFLLNFNSCHFPSGMTIHEYGVEVPIRISSFFGCCIEYDVGTASGDLVIHAVDGRELRRTSVSGSGTFPWNMHIPGVYVYAFHDNATGRRWTGRILAE